MDAVTGLRASTNYGRPNLDQIFSGLCHLHPGTEIGVFFCGPLALSNQLYFFCNKYNQPVADGTKFHFGKENF
jgi:NADPH oxidase